MAPPLGNPPLKLGVSYYGNRIPWRVKEDLQEIRKIGCNYVVHTFSEEDLEFYQGAMAKIIATSHELGLEVWLDPWGVGQVFGGETYSSLIAKSLVVRQVNSYGDSLPIACPNHPAFREYLIQWIEAAARWKADVLFWDEPHFFIYPEPEGDAVPKLWACRCSVCQILFRERLNEPMPEGATPEVRSFKEGCLVEWVRFLGEETAKRGLKSAVCLLPFENSSTVNDWAKVAALDSVSIIGTDPYWKPHQPDVEAYVSRFAKRIQELADRYKKEGQIWILNFNIPKGEEISIRKAVEGAYVQGIRNFAAWSYYGAAYIKLRAEDPQTVWETLAQTYGELLQKEG